MRVYRWEKRYEMNYLKEYKHKEEWEGKRDKR
jgi:hypothetical protein